MSKWLHNYAVYRKVGIGSTEYYQRVSQTFETSRPLPVNSFGCYNDILLSLITVQAEDVLGACVFDKGYGNGLLYWRNQLNIVGVTTDPGDFLLATDADKCTMHGITHLYHLI